MIHGILYPCSDHHNGGDILINELKKKKNYFDVFPKKKDLKINKKFKVRNNFCIFILNVPWSYHSVSKYMSNKDRKYFYVAYDFKIPKKGSIAKNRKKGYNANLFWKNSVEIKSKARKKIFFYQNKSSTKLMCHSNFFKFKRKNISDVFKGWNSSCVLKLNLKKKLQKNIKIFEN